MASTLLSAAVLFFASVRAVHAESHTVKFDNRCGFGTPQLIKGGDVLTTTSYTSTGQLSAAIAYLQTGSCGFNGEQCTLLEMTMVNPVAVGGGSSADISLIDPHAFSVPTRIEFYDGCDGVGTTCDAPGCNTAFKQPDDTWVQIACQTNNANLLITFCPDGSPSAPSNTTAQHATTTGRTTTTTTTPDKPKTTTSSKISATFTSVDRSSTPTTAASSSSTTAASFSSTSASTPSSTSTSMCKHTRSERRAINAHRKRGHTGRGLHR
ncbi:hypothetical protein B0H17DRAFT_1042305 [Mycena rosella]|uniref:Glycopeptide n=1 Tax=Mycena rosella TaxID=1033263 RepID=A0AAD7E281_MYCRO|nr:hypothetical protein B0H17DRAFT_1042305 [Mycena rosella]